jgi:hypothetical protein
MRGRGEERRGEERGGEGRRREGRESKMDSRELSWHSDDHKLPYL